MRRAFLAFLLCIAGGSSALASPAEIVLPLKTVIGKPVVTVVLADGSQADLFFDTGAGGAVVDRSLAERLHLSSRGEARVASPGGEGVPASQVALTLRLAGQPFEIDALAMDRGPLIAGHPDLPAGVLGPRSFPGYLVTLDMAAGRLVLDRGALPAADGKNVFSAGDDPQLFSVPVDLAGRSLRLVLDSGASGGISLPLASAEGLPLEAAPQVVGRGRRVDREVVIYGARLRGNANVAGEVLENPRIRFDDALQQGLLGNEVLGRMEITLDEANRRVRLRPSPAAPATPMMPTTPTAALR
jgi:hypothetical protein